VRHQTISGHASLQGSEFPLCNGETYASYLTSVICCCQKLPSRDGNWAVQVRHIVSWNFNHPLLKSFLRYWQGHIYQTISEVLPLKYPSASKYHVIPTLLSGSSRLVVSSSTLWSSHDDVPSGIPFADTGAGVYSNLTTH
jgi:hypothetical protein